VPVWRRCSTCKKEIMTGQTYYVCSVSTCNSRSTQYVFCSVACWDAHVPVERHRGDSAGAIEKKAPLTVEPDKPVEGKRRVVPGAPNKAASSESDDDILVVASKIRKYINDKSGMNVSASLYEALSEKLRGLCEMAIESARADGRKTVMDRDVL
jgi:hypothetical protein